MNKNLDWKQEAQGVISDIGENVAHVAITEALKSEEEIYLNLQTLEGDKYTIKLNARGYTIVGKKFDNLDEVEEEVNGLIYFETIYCLLQSISPKYVSSFAESLRHKLSLLEERMEIDKEIMNRSINDSLQYYNSDLETTTTVNSAATPTIQTLQQKINRAKKRILEEQKARDENVEEYLKTAAVAHRNQLPQVKAVFEKRNTKAATRIAAFQRKLERYQQDLQELEKRSIEIHRSPVKKDSGNSPKNTLERLQGGSEASGSSAASSQKAAKGRLQHVGHGIKSVSENLKDGITGISGTVITKPIASYLMKQKFGSADNIPHVVAREDGTRTVNHYHGSANLPNTINAGEARISKGSGNVTRQGQIGENDRPGSDCSESAQSSSIGQENRIFHSQDVKIIIQQLQEIREDFASFREDFENFKTQVNTDSSLICQGLQEERFRAERLEEQVNDLTELHQAETGNLKQALADAEEKLSYQSEERLRDLAEMLEACQTKISRLEQQQQLVTIDGIENSAARALAVKLVNVGLTMLQLLLLLVATVASALAPFLGSRFRLFSSIGVGVGVFIAHRKWPQAQEAIIEFGTELLNRLI